MSFSSIIETSLWSAISLAHFLTFLLSPWPEALENNAVFCQSAISPPFSELCVNNMHCMGHCVSWQIISHHTISNQDFLFRPLANPALITPRSDTSYRDCLYDEVTCCVKKAVCLKQMHHSQYLYYQTQPKVSSFRGGLTSCQLKWRHKHRCILFDRCPDWRVKALRKESRSCGPVLQGWPRPFTDLIFFVLIIYHQSFVHNTRSEYT